MAKRDPRGRKPLDKDGSTQISMRLPDSWLEEADVMLKKIPEDGTFLTRVDILRRMIRLGFDTAKQPGRR